MRHSSFASGFKAITIWRSLELFVYEDALKQNLKIINFKAAAVEVVKQYVILFEGRSIREDMLGFWNAISEFRRQRDRPIFSVVGFDALEYIYGKDEELW